MFMKAASRARLTTSLFSTTFIIAVLTVAAPQLVPCPVTPNHLGADATKKQKQQQQQHQQEKETGNLEWQGKSVVVIDRD